MRCGSTSTTPSAESAAYLPVFKESVMFGLQQLVDDNIQYVELRIILGAMYDENGTVYTHAQEFQIWLDTLRGSFQFPLNPTASFLFDSNSLRSSSGSSFSS
jgi:hypothetical protein